jgi:hypothetical protein
VVEREHITRPRSVTGQKNARQLKAGAVGHHTTNKRRSRNDEEKSQGKTGHCPYF